MYVFCNPATGGGHGRDGVIESGSTDVMYNIDLADDENLSILISQYLFGLGGLENICVC